MNDSAPIQPAGKSYAALWTYLFLVYAAVVLLYPVIFSKEASFCIKQDNLHQAYPFFYKLTTSLHKGYLPVWDANTYGGKNFSGELQTGIFYPLNIVWCLLFGSAKGIDVYWLDLLVAFHFLICLIGMYKVARVFKLPMVAACVSALVFTFSSAVAARAGAQTCIFFGLTLMPWAIYFLGRYYLVRRHIKWLLFAGLVTGMEILAGHIQPFFHTVVISGIIILFFEYRDRRDWKQFFGSAVVKVVLVVVVAFLIALPQLYYAAEYLSRCYRSVSGGTLIGPGQKVPWLIYGYRFIINPSNLPNLVGKEYAAPDDGNLLYMGILPLFLLILYIARHRSMAVLREHILLTRLLLIILAIGILSVLGYLTFFSFLLYKIPFVNAIRQLGRYVILISFSASLLVGLGITYLSELKKWLFSHSPNIKFYVLTVLCLNVLYLIFFQEKFISVNVTIPWLLGFLFFLILLYVKKTIHISIVALAFVCVDLYLNPVTYSPTRTIFYPPNYYKRNRIYDFLETTYGKYRVDFDMQDYDRVRRNLGDLYAIQTKFGYGATLNKSYLDFLDFNGGNDHVIDDLLNIKYVLTDKLLDSGYVFRDSIKGLHLYEKTHYYPRVYWKSQIGKGGGEIERENQASIRQLAYSDLYQKIEIDCVASDTLVLSENYYPGWECTDNGKKIAITAAIIKNYPPLFRSVVLDKGHHIVEFRYNKVFYWF